MGLCELAISVLLRLSALLKDGGNATKPLAGLHTLQLPCILVQLTCKMEFLGRSPTYQQLLTILKWGTDD